MRGAFWWVDRYRQSNAYRDLSLAEQGAFRNLCDELWLRDGVLPDDQRALANSCGDATMWPEVKKAVMSKFYRVPEGWRNRTHDEVSGQSKAFKERQSEKGRKRAEQAARDGGKFQPKNQPEDQPSHQPDGPAEPPAENQPSVLRSPFSVNGSPEQFTGQIARVPDIPAIDRLDEDLAFEEIRFRDLAIAAGRDNIQAVLDSLPRPTTRAPFSASRWLATGRTGIPRDERALTALRLTCDALEARARAQGAVHLSDSNRETLENIRRVGERMKAKEAQTNKPKEITG